MLGASHRHHKRARSIAAEYRLENIELIVFGMGLRVSFVLFHLSILNIRAFLNTKDTIIHVIISLVE